MRCPGCGSDNPDSKKFCTNCGKPLADAPTQVQPPPSQPTTQMTPVPAAPVVVPVQPTPVKAKSSKKGWIIALCIVLALIVVGAAIAIPLIIAASNKPVAQVTQVKIVRTDGTTVDTTKVPLETEVALKATYSAKFKASGSGTIQLVVKSSSGETIVDKTFDVTSSGSPQSKEVKFTMSEGSGKPLSGNAKLVVTQAASKLNSAKAVSFKMVAGKGQKLQLAEAVAVATKKCQIATENLKSTAAKGIDITDLADRLSKGLTTLASAKTVAEANSVAGIAQTVIDECNARIAAQAQAGKSREICRQNQAVVRAKLVDWWGGSGNFPDSMSQLYGLPVCPDGGTYTYYAPDTTPATLHVTCSVHGEL